jgi:AcrR family transcriptional regulator
MELTAPAPSTATESLPRAVRRRAREEIVREIIESARRQLATEGAPGLSLRAVARELGVASSALYRYVSSRDELLTLLIIEGYDALGAAAEAAESTVDSADLAARWLAVCHAVRDWALAHPHEYALLYGSPVPGYVAPEATVGPATRVTVLLVHLLVDAVSMGAVSQTTRTTSEATDVPAPELWQAALHTTRPFVPAQIPDDLLLRGLTAWTHLFGAVSFELFGHLQQVIGDHPDLRRAYFGEQATRLGALVGFKIG